MLISHGVQISMFVVIMLKISNNVTLKRDKNMFSVLNPAKKFTKKIKLTYALNVLHFYTASIEKVSAKTAL